MGTVAAVELTDREIEREGFNMIRWDCGDTCRGEFGIEVSL